MLRCVSTWSVFLVVVYCFLFACVLVNAQSTDPNDLEVLQYIVQTYPTWAALKYWNPSTDPCLITSAGSGWTGVTCSYGSQFANVAELNLQADLQVLPPELANLTSLYGLVLRGCNISGSLPPALGNLASLSYIDLSNNHLTGVIPPEWEGLVNLRSLILNNNQLSGELPPEVSNWQSLERLMLPRNNFTGSLPEGFGNLTALQHLNLVANQFNGQLPSEILQLTNLKLLYLDNNHFNGLLPDLGELPLLEIVSLSENDFTGPLPNFNNTNLLSTFIASSNSFTGSIPSTYTSLPRLQRLWLGCNRLSGSLDDNLIRQSFNASFPSAYASTLHLEGNMFSGPFPASLQNPPPSTMMFNLSCNNFDGPLPAYCDAAQGGDGTCSACVASSCRTFTGDSKGNNNPPPPVITVPTDFQDGSSSAARCVSWLGALSLRFLALRFLLPV